jgi:hypothetical protein
MVEWEVAAPRIDIGERISQFGIEHISLVAGNKIRNTH